ncbi:hypothetical protein CBM2605_A110019 [Cupriavidus neocaledonicus]|uniref:Transposase n=1 Tax=Cupriavidus neocaledonicus TaxID=1040979 RepID=A0ABY1UX43_9BURK|nr:hypothetical protein CBM2605_A110019 [Cupriavidus neocaledonicus]
MRKLFSGKACRGRLAQCPVRMAWLRRTLVELRGKTEQDENQGPV